MGQQPLLAFPVDFGMLDLGSDQQWPARMLADGREQASPEPGWAVGQHGSPRGVDPRPEAEESARWCAAGTTPPCAVVAKTKPATTARPPMPPKALPMTM